MPLSQVGGRSGSDCRHAQRAGGQDGAGVRFIQVGAHTGHIADVVAHVVRHYSRIARIVLGNAGLNLTNQVRTHIRRLCINASTEPGKQRLHGGAHPEAEHGRGD